LSVFVPLAARAASAAASGSLRRDEAVQRQLAKRFVAALEGLGPAFVKVRAW
jgi:predicted unusual protein kinase regulating ubiquinone biosynthesis (AarF/ABC1/UbiB family)